MINGANFSKVGDCNCKFSGINGDGNCDLQYIFNAEFMNTRRELLKLEHL